MLEVKNLMVFFENALAINDLSLEVREGELVGVIGSNSAGENHPYEFPLGFDYRHAAQRNAQRRGAHQPLRQYLV